MLVVLLIAAVLIIAGLYLIAQGRRTAAPSRQTEPDTKTDATPAGVIDPAPAPAPNDPAPDDHVPDDHVPDAPPPNFPPFADPVPDDPLQDGTILDHSVLDRLRSVDDDDVLAALIDSFLRGGPEQLDTIEATLEARDPLPGLATLGLFRTSARLLGASQVEHRAGQLQAALEAGDSDAACVFLQEVLDAFDVAAGALRAFPSAA